MPPQNTQEQNATETTNVLPDPAVVNAGHPGKTLGIIGLVMAFLFFPLGFVLSLIAYMQSKKGGYKNTPALIGIIYPVVFVVGMILYVLALGYIFGHSDWQF